MEIFDDVAFGQGKLQRRLVVAEALEDNRPTRRQLIGNLRFGRNILRRVSDHLSPLFHSLKAFFVQGALHEIVKGGADKKIQVRDFRQRAQSIGDGGIPLFVFLAEIVVDIKRAVAEIGMPSHRRAQVSLQGFFEFDAAGVGVAPRQRAIEGGAFGFAGKLEQFLADNGHDVAF